MGLQVPIVFAPKFRRKAIYGKYKADIGKKLRELCTWKGVEIIEAHACVDHVHMHVKIPPKMSVSYFMGYLKGKSTLLIFERHAEYMKNQEKEDMLYEQISIKEYMDPFNPDKNNNNKPKK